jgi:hypothetical protein
MASKRTHDVTATVGEYTAANGAVKKRYVNVGSLFTGDDGRMSIKLESIPVGQEWSGWLSIFPVKDKDDRESQRRQDPGTSRQGKEPYTGQPDPGTGDEDDIPF